MNENNEMNQSQAVPQQPVNVQPSFSNEMSQPQAVPQQPVSAQPSVNGGKNNNSLLVIIALVVLVAVGAFVYVKYIHKPSNPEPPADNVENNNNNNNNSDNNAENPSDNNGTEPTNKDEVISSNNNWKNYAFSINGKNLSLPISYNEFKAASGFELKSTYLNTTIPANHYVLASLYLNDNLASSVELFNKTNSDLKYVDSNITRLTQSKFNITSGAPAIVFPGNLKIGMNITKEEIFSALGETTNVKDYNLENYAKTTYKYVSDDTWTTFNYYEIEVLNGVIDSITLDHRS